MSGSSGGPPRGVDPPPWNSGTSRRIDGSQVGRTFPAYFDHNDEMGELMILRLQGVNGHPLPTAPFMIRKSIHRFLNGKIESAFKEGGGRTYALKTRSKAQFAKLQQMTKLDDGTAVQVIEHPIHNSVRCMVYCRDVVDYTTTELEEELAEQAITKVHRITKRVGDGKQNTPLLVCTVRGTVRPDHINFGYVRCSTRPYYPSPMQCFNCWAFGHTKIRCKSASSICGTCSGAHPIAENRKCTEPVFCSKCNNSSHALASRSCPAYQSEDRVQRIRVDQDCSYPEAKRILQAEMTNTRPTFAEVAHSGLAGETGGGTIAPITTNHSAEFQHLNSRIDELISVIQQRDERIASLEATVTNTRKLNTPVEQLLAHQEEKFNATLQVLEKQNQQLRELNLRLINEMHELRKSVQSTITTTATKNTSIAGYNQAASKPVEPVEPVERTSALALLGEKGDSSPIEVVTDSDNSSTDSSPNQNNQKDTPRPTRSSTVDNMAKSKRTGTPIPIASPITPKRSLTESIASQQVKKAKHRNVSGNLGTTPKR